MSHTALKSEKFGKLNNSITNVIESFGLVHSEVTRRRE